MKDYWFFLSYAKRDAVKSTVIGKFFSDLALKIGPGATLPTELTEREIGFFDELGIETGEHWRDTLTEAIQSTRTLVCLHSRSYFKSEFCGKEFGAFRSRLGAQNQNAPLIIPVLWDMPGLLPKLPKVVSDIQFKHADLGEVYAQQGLEMIMKLSRYKDDYEIFLANLANRLVHVAQAHILNRLQPFPSLDEADDAFRPKPPMSTPVSGNDEESNPDDDVFVGPSYAKFFYASAQGPLWQPYEPDESVAVGNISTKAAAETNLMPIQMPDTVLLSPRDLIKQLQRFEKTNTVVVIVVDPKSITMYKKPLAELDGRTFVNCGILIPYKDVQGTSGQSSASSHVRQLFSKSFLLNSNYIKDSISSAQHLEEEFISAIMAVRRRIQSRQDVFRAVAPIDGSAAVVNSLPKIVNTASNG